MGAEGHKGAVGPNVKAGTGSMSEATSDRSKSLRAGAMVRWLACVVLAATAPATTAGEPSRENIGVPDEGEAVSSVRKAAEQGDAAAQFNLGVMYDRGEGVPQDDGEALLWYRKAAEQGHAAAQFNLGNMYRYGRGVPDDYIQAYAWLNLAAAQGDGDARDGRAALRELMTRAQIAEAQKLSRELVE